jgi:patatin-like phospholipase/acyl hydrolase
MPNESDHFTILSLDGGGIRGIIPALILHEIEERCKTPIANLFNLIAGTSTGGILALGLTVPDGANSPRYSASDLVEFYEEEGADIFQRSGWGMFEGARSLFDEKYDAKPIETALRNRFGRAMLADVLTPVLIPAYEIEQRKPYFFKSKRAQQNNERARQRNVPVWEAARATSAAPTYFSPYKMKVESPIKYLALVDGGVYANNPAACALVEAINEFGADPSKVFMVSIGTGVHTKSIEYGKAVGWGLLDWARPILDVVFDGVSDTVDFQMGQLLNVDGRNRDYYRLQPELDDATDAMDNAGRKNIRQLKIKAEDLINDKDNEIDAICERLCPHNYVTDPAG